jgi:hypothetical protein
MRKIEFEIGERLNALLTFWTFFALVIYVVEKLT